MAIDAQTLANESACYICSGATEFQALELALLARISSGGISPPGPEATKYLVTSSDYAPAAGDGVTITAQLSDASNNPVATAGLIVTWSKTGAGGSFGSPTSVTNASGIATVTFTTSITAGTVYVVTGTDNNGLTGSTSNITSVAGPAAKYIVTADDYTPDALQVVAITAQLTDVNNNPVSTAGLVVTWSKTGTGGSFSAPTSNTNGSGIATINFTAQIGTYAVTATDTNAMTGTTANIVTALSALNSDWVTRIIAAGGVQPSDNTLMANDIWYAALGSAGIQGKVKVCNTYAPDALIAAKTPLIKGSASDSWGNVGTILAGALTVDGLALNGTTQYLTTGMNCVTEGMTSATNHGCVYVFTDDRSTTQNEFGTGTDATTSFRLYYHYTDNNTYYSNVGNVVSAGTILGAADNPGWMCVSRTTTTRLDIYVADSGTAFSSVFNSTANVAANLLGSNAVFAHASNEVGVAGNFSKKRISFMSFGTGLSSAEAQAFFNATQTLRTSYGGGAI